MEITAAKRIQSCAKYINLCFFSSQFLSFQNLALLIRWLLCYLSDVGTRTRTCEDEQPKIERAADGERARPKVTCGWRLRSGPTGFSVFSDLSRISKGKGMFSLVCRGTHRSARNIAQSSLSCCAASAVGSFHLSPPVIERKRPPLTTAMSTAPPPIASKTNGIEKSVWVEFIQLALEVKPLNLGQGFPDFAAPDTVRKALAQACTDEKNVLLNQYTRGFGHPRLIAALSKLYSKLIGRELNPLSEVLVTAGAYEALFVTIMGLVNQGDEVIIIEPFFDCYVPQVKLAGGTPVFVPLRPKKPSGTMSSADWVLDPVELEAAFSEKTKAIIVNTPNNPLGKVKPWVNFHLSETEIFQKVNHSFQPLNQHSVFNAFFNWSRLHLHRPQALHTQLERNTPRHREFHTQYATIAPHTPLESYVLELIWMGPYIMAKLAMETSQTISSVIIALYSEGLSRHCQKGCSRCTTEEEYQFTLHHVAVCRLSETARLFGWVHSSRVRELMDIGTSRITGYPYGNPGRGVSTTDYAVPHPPNLPDLNPTENAWAVMGRTSPKIISTTVTSSLTGQLWHKSNCALQMDASLSSPAPKSGRPPSTPQTSSLTEMGAQAGTSWNSCCSYDCSPEFKPKGQSEMTQQETKELNDGRKVCLPPLNPNDGRVKMVLFGFSLSYDVDLITSYPQGHKSQMSRRTRAKMPRGISPGAWLALLGKKRPQATRASSLSATLPGMWERTITIGSAGKTFSVTGWKTGWAYGPSVLMKGPQVIHQHSVYTCTTPVQEAVAQGFEIEMERFGTPECYFKSLPAELEVKRDNIVKILEDAGLYPIIPEGGYFILADVTPITSKIDIGGDPNERKDFRFVKWLSRNRKLQGIPPSAFYSPDHGQIGENYIRFCFIKEDENLEKAGEILRALKKDIDDGNV
ncbi:uncharacterized protein LOC119572532 [Penaeus monodon]|uniref:uncharacterized protein LOC119572532 n=1 Tax=Penaeus monodon TaxID=6687 RepID=UPI0018A7898B|nr:uncharacterized protein LOC119572532 [Penaeus monodon]